MRIGEVASQAGVKIDTLRYYEKRGLLDEPVRTPSGYREYPSEAVRLVRFIKRAQELGFTLHEIEDLVRLREDEGSTCAEVRDAARAKVDDIDARLRCLLAMKKALELLLRSCRKDGSRRHCPILEALDDSSDDGRSR